MPLGGFDARYRRETAGSGAEGLGRGQSSVGRTPKWGGRQPGYVLFSQLAKPLNARQARVLRQ